MTYGYCFEIVEQSLSRIPWRALALVHHVVAVLGTDGDEHHVLDVQGFRHLAVVCYNLVIDFLGEANEIHLIDSHYNVWNAEQRRNIAVAHSLLEYTMACVYKDNAQISSTGSGDHVARVLNVSRGVSNDKLTFRCCEIAVSHVDGDALLALCTQSVSEQCEVHLLVSPAF